MPDLDHFKSVNDTYGHLVGDRVLQCVVRAAQQVLREGDVLLRYGGEEFLVVLPGAGRDDLEQMVNGSDGPSPRRRSPRPTSASLSL